ncbi:MAG: hypothetical protein M3N54_15095 [Acidobacteriota bacterium]|nr:hypothetical protein [Acidobacteriota bacterium]
MRNKVVWIPLVLATLLPARRAQPLFREDFESGAIDPAVWSQQTTGDSILKIQSERAAHGKYALLARCPTPAQRTMAFVTLKHLPEELHAHHFGRAYVYVTPKLPARHTMLIFAGTPGFPKYKYEEVATLNGRFQLTYVDQVDGGEDWHSGGPDIPLDRWFLLEWEFNDRPSQATVWLDGEKAYNTDFTFKNAGENLVGGFTDVAFGFRLWGAAPQPFDVYFDDIALDTARIGPIK